jgi:tripartite-type tricarboxylate transporter receptor subunit TctC
MYLHQASRAWALLTPLLALSGTGSALAQAWPQRPIRIVIPHPPGGPSDFVVRTMTDKLQAALKQPVVIENQPGAGGNIGAANAARAAPDGYTWLVGTDTVMTVNPHVYKTMPFKPDDFKPVSVLSSFSQTLVCNPAVGVRTLAELIAKARSTSLSYASGGAGVPGHLSMELLLSMTGMQMVHVPYKGPAPATQDVLANQVPCGLLAGPTVLPHVRAGKLTALAVSGAERSPTLPDVPTMAEAGVKGYEADFSLVLLAPRQTPDDIVNRFRQAVVDALNTADASDKLKATDQVVIGSTPEAAAARLTKDLAKWGAVARKIGLSLD